MLRFEHLKRAATGATAAVDAAQAAYSVAFRLCAEVLEGAGDDAARAAMRQIEADLNALRASMAKIAREG